MAISYIKKGKSAQDKAQADAQARETVQKILADVQERKDKAVRELSQKFDGWNPADFKLSNEQIQEIIGTLSPHVIADIQFAQEQVRKFATAQRAALQDIEVETLPGVILGHKNIPVNRVGCYVPGGRYPMVASAHMDTMMKRGS